MFDHQFFDGPAHDQIALLVRAAVAKASRRHAARVLALLAAIAAAVLLVATIVMAWYVCRLELAGWRTGGQVIAIRVDAGDRDREPIYYPVIEFTTASGARLRFEDFGGSSPRYRVGDRVTVLYRSDEASRFAVVDRGRGSNLLLPLLPFGGAVLAGWLFVHRMWPAPRFRTSGRAAPRMARRGAAAPAAGERRPTIAAMSAVIASLLRRERRPLAPGKSGLLSFVTISLRSHDRIERS